MVIEEPVYSIYLCRNTVNTKVYVGFSVNVASRIQVHLSIYKKEDTKFYRAMRKHGKDKFFWEVIYQSKDREHCLNIMEPYFIEEYDSYKNGYNSTRGGDGAFGVRISDEGRRKISEANKLPKKGNPGKWKRERTQKDIDNLENARKLITLRSPEKSRKISEALTGKPKTAEHILAMKNRPQDTKTLVCNFCGKEGDYKNMKRWHFENCKKNPARVDNTKDVECNVCGYVAKQSPNFYRNHNENCRNK